MTYFRKRWHVALGFVLLVLLIATYFYKPYAVNKKSIVEKPSATWRSVYHFTVPDHWMNDPQRPIYFDGQYHFFISIIRIIRQGMEQLGDMPSPKI